MPWTDLEDRLLILNSMAGDFRDDQIAERIAYFLLETNARPSRSRRSESEVRRRIHALMDEGRIPQRWRKDCLCDNFVLSLYRRGGRRDPAVACFRHTVLGRQCLRATQPVGHGNQVSQVLPDPGRQAGPDSPVIR